MLSRWQKKKLREAIISKDEMNLYLNGQVLQEVCPFITKDHSEIVRGYVKLSLYMDFMLGH